MAAPDAIGTRMVNAQHILGSSEIIDTSTFTEGEAPKKKRKVGLDDSDATTSSGTWINSTWIQMSRVPADDSESIDIHQEMTRSIPVPNLLLTAKTNRELKLLIMKRNRELKLLIMKRILLYYETTKLCF